MHPLTRENSFGPETQDRRVPDPQETQEHWEVGSERCLKEVLVHAVGACEELLYWLRSVVQR